MEAILRQLVKQRFNRTESEYPFDDTIHKIQSSDYDGYYYIKPKVGSTFEFNGEAVEAIRIDFTSYQMDDIDSVYRNIEMKVIIDSTIEDYYFV